VRLPGVVLGLTLPLAAAQDRAMPAPGSPLEALDRGAHRCFAAQELLLCQVSDAARLRIEGVPVRARILAYRGGRLERVTTIVDEARFAELLSALESRWGPGGRSTERLRAGMGGVFPNLMVTWRFEGRVALLEQYYERVTQSALSVMAPAAFDVYMSERERQRAGGMRDL
jgi:hypothetical protein